MIDDATGRKAVRLARRTERSRNRAAALGSGTADGGRKPHFRDDVHQRGVEAAKRALHAFRANQRSAP